MSGKELAREGREENSIPAWVLLQVLEDGRRNPSSEILARVIRKEITRPKAICLMHPALVAGCALIVLVLVYVLSAL